MPKSNQSSSKAPTQGSASSAGTGGQTKYSFIKNNWGSRPNFQASFGLKMTPEDIEEGNAILDAFMEQDRRDAAAQRK
ncbi:hypothetical protein SODALDRAFT_360855 [Sodiomyces alkalinus F11]|uniref:Uncharacterized protein n=1 Tax=Sodiomyces alkalinus (strain CBS 110278 / VKM F-3762 / F11) TaxID=1314773 RepID=A0A3N2PRT0_SODAK|nr:hypothetical protein SODALDRAFT_360855 [Sodiomyces alkalinus F11]ROT37170.1 hypothetical protein SODALDRAFT_360855 [Sodiomyces alkalinus F11]